MSAAVWKLRRLAAMGPAEAARRARIALRDRVAPPAYARLAPAAAFERLYGAGAEDVLRASRLARLVHVPADARACAPALAAAEALARGRWSLFGHEVALADPPDWQANPLTGERWPDLPSRALDYRRADLAGGAKYAWEAGRLTMLPLLALSSRLARGAATGEAAGRKAAGAREPSTRLQGEVAAGEAAAGGETAARGTAAGERALAWLEDFTVRNPLGRGIHHTSGIEMAVRVLTTTWTLALLGERAAPARAAPSLGLLAQQALWCRDHLSLGSSANNHLLSEYAAMAVAGAAFPALRGADALLDRALEGLARQTLRQIHEDGVTAEQAFGYQPFVWELLLCAFVAAEAAGRAVPEAVKRRLAASLEFARAVRLPGGTAPQVGDEDDGRILLAAEGWSRLDLVGDALAAWLGADALGDAPALALLLFGRAAAPARDAAEGRRDFDAGGYTVWRERGALVTFDHGPLGLGPLAAHGHADALSVTIFRGRDAVVVDPGTFAYQEDPAARDFLRATPAHGTVHFGGGSQSEILGPFLWGRRARVTRQGQGWLCTWASGERHWRGVEVAGGLVTLEDRVEGRGAEIVFPLHPDATVALDGGRAVVTVGGTAATFEADAIEDWRREEALHSPRFGWKRPAARLCARLATSACRTTIRLAG